MLRMLFAKDLDFLVNRGIVASSYPQSLRLWLLKLSVIERNLNISRDVSQPEIVLSVFQRLWSTSLRLEESDLRLDKIQQKFDNPTTKNINWIMGLLDLPHYLNGIPTIQVNGIGYAPEGIIHELSNRRNNIAHGDTTENPDIDRAVFLLKFARLLANRIDRDVRMKIQGFDGHDYP